MADKGLADAVNVALLLGQPLLLTGEPGTGKTQLAHRIAWQLGFEPPLGFETKSTSTARDSSTPTIRSGASTRRRPGRQGSQKTLDYITYNALGVAILLSNDYEDVRQRLPQGAGVRERAHRRR